jgi:hypothetical protein
MTFNLRTLTIAHVVISLVGIGSGFVVMCGLLTANDFPVWTAIFLSTTLATSVTGFLFPFQKFTPAIGVGIVSMIALALAIPALYIFDLSGGWRNTYVVSSVVALYLNVFVGIVQAFQKLPKLKVLAPKQSEPPFVFTQLAVLLLFVVLGIFTTIRFQIAQV